MEDTDQSETATPLEARSRSTVTLDTDSMDLYTLCVGMVDGPINHQSAGVYVSWTVLKLP